MQLRSEKQFRKDLPRLVKTHYGQWVAYHGATCVAFGKTKLDVYHECQQQGLERGEYVVRLVDPIYPPDYDCTPAMDSYSR